MNFDSTIDGQYILNDGEQVGGCVADVKAAQGSISTFVIEAIHFAKMPVQTEKCRKICSMTYASRKNLMRLMGRGDTLSLLHLHHP